jgi:sugar transferase (PEP-CTERM/EpsH1 system associated)
MGDILFLAHRVPYPPDRGDKIRSFNILKRLGAMATIHVATFADDEADMAHGEALRKLLGPMLESLHIERRGVSTPMGAAKALLTGKPVSLPLFDSAAIRRFVAETLKEKPVSTVFAFSGQMAQFVPDLPSHVRFIMDFVDVDSAKFSAYAEAGSGPMKFAHAREAKKLFAFERWIAERADCSLFVSDAEAQLFRERAGLSPDKIRALENGIDCGFFDPEADFPRAEAPGSGPLLVFTGQMDYRPNIEAVQSFVSETLPVVRAHRPDARFAIVGRNPPAEVRELAGEEGIIVTGVVDDIRSWLAAADVVVAPLRIARGIQNKVLEAMAMAKPVVASEAAFEGIDAEPGRDLAVAAWPDQEGRAILGLLRYPERAVQMGRAARERMLERYSWEAALAPLAELVGERPIEAAA